MTEVDTKYLSKEYQENNVRWITDSSHDLFLWYENHKLVRFQFAFGKNTSHEQLVEWEYHRGIKEFTIDDGEQTINSRFKSTPIISTQTILTKDYISAFTKLAEKIDSVLYEEIFSWLTK